MKLLDPRSHGYLDYLAVAVFLLAPSLLGFGGTAAAVCYVLGVVQLGMSLLTAYPISVAKIIPFPAHGGVELATSIFLVLAPWLFDFAHVDAAFSFFLVAGIGLLLVYLITDYKAADSYRMARTTRRGRVESHA